MPFNLFRKPKVLQSPVLLDKYQGDKLDQKMTEIAINLINESQGPEFRKHFISLFKNDPRFIKNVAPEYREALQQVLDKSEL